jgi:nanoRNase/pAp phosphatase (c-di-AMP/oligoRNAs hydrolase)
MKIVNKHFESIGELIELCKLEDYVYIQPHNFPDHDAIASAYGLQEFFLHFGIKSKIVYDGTIQRDTLKALIEKLEIEIIHIDRSTMKNHHKIIVVDGSKGNSNVTDFIGDEIAVIDHHEVEVLEEIEFSDIRSDYGACSSIIYDYYKEYGISPSSKVATALIIGINVDTAMLTRKVNQKDLDAFVGCYNNADMEFVNYQLRSMIKINDLNYYKFLLDSYKIEEKRVFCYFPQGCDQNLLGILSDFMLSVQEVDTVLLCAKNNERINLSMRNAVKGLNLSKIILELLKNIGLGGGHENMAGGIIFNTDNFEEDKFMKRYFEKLKIYNQEYL